LKLKKSVLKDYLFDRRMVNLPRVRFGGVKAGEVLGAGSLIWIVVAFLLMTFLAFLGVGGVAATLRLPARVCDDPTLGPFDDVSTDSALGVWAEIATAGIGPSPSKPRMGVMSYPKPASKHIKNK
jgi:hypothetical protein